MSPVVPAAKSATADVFISYSSRDIDRVLVVARHLEAAGISIWRDGDQLLAGEYYGERIVQAIEQSRVVVLMCSTNAFASDNVFREVILTWEDGNRRFLPLMLENNLEIPQRLKYCLAGLQRIEVADRPPDAWLPPVLLALSKAGVQPGQRQQPAPDGRGSAGATASGTDSNKPEREVPPSSPSLITPVLAAKGRVGKTTLVIGIIAIVAAMAAVVFGINFGWFVDAASQGPERPKPPLPPEPEVVVRVGSFSLSLPTEFRRGDPMNAFAVKGRPDSAGWIVAFSCAKDSVLWYVQDYLEIGREKPLKFTWVPNVSEAEVLLCQVARNELPDAIKNKRPGLKKQELDELLPQSVWSAPHKVRIVP